jgi:prepilin-type N-terminal cleavage/methylation domain-containing protein
MNIKKQKGFTLVEIAIVLVIIGLLLGGILKGQELINSARVRNLADQNSGIQAAYYGFIDRYRQVPGDWLNTSASQAIGVTVNLPTAVAGITGNGRVDNTLIEASAVWEQLAKSNFLGGGYTPAAAAPASAAAYVTDQVGPVNAFNGPLVLSRNQGFTGTNADRLNLHMGPNIPVSIARELDVKVDDGLPNTGVLRLTNSDTSSTTFDGAAGSTAAGEIFAGQSSTCSTDSGSNAAGTTDGDPADNTDIYDIFDDAQNCGQVFLY